jgi:tetratricopeptide (TPR) repeat protein
MWFFDRFYVFLLLNFCFFGELQSQQLKTYYDYGVVPEIMSKDSVSVFLEDHYVNAQKEGDTLLLIKSLVSKSAFERSEKNFGDAFNYAGDALFLAEEYADIRMKAYANEEFGILSFLFRQDDQSSYYLKKAHEFYKLTDVYLGRQSDIQQSYYNLVLYYHRTRDISSFKKYIDTCRTYNRKPDKFLEIRLDEKLSSIKAWNGHYKETLETLNSLEKQIENEVNNDGGLLNEHSFLIIIYGKIGNVNKKLRRFDVAKKYFEKSIAVSDVFNENLFFRSFIYSRYAEMLFDYGDYKEAYVNKEKEDAINDAYLNLRSFKNHNYLTLKNHYKDQLDKKTVLLHKQELALAENNQKILGLRVLTVGVVLLVLIFGFVVRSRLRYLKFQKEVQDSNELLVLKNKELTINTLQLIEREEVISELKEQLKNIKPDKSNNLLLKSIDKRSSSLWDNFNKRFTDQNVGFYERLQKRVPNLSSSNLKLCALIKLNFSGKEMAYLLGISLGSVHVARHRLRKKMNMSRSDNLMSFINSI